MLDILASSIDILIQFVAVFLCRRYVFLEKGFAGKKQNYFNLISVCSLLVFNLLLGAIVAQVLLFSI